MKSYKMTKEGIGRIDMWPIGAVFMVAFVVLIYLGGRVLEKTYKK